MFKMFKQLSLSTSSALCRFIAFKLKINLSDCELLYISILQNSDIEFKANYIIEYGKSKIFANRVPLKYKGIKLFLQEGALLGGYRFYISSSYINKTLSSYYVQKIYL